MGNSTAEIVVGGSSVDGFVECFVEIGTGIDNFVGDSATGFVEFAFDSSDVSSVAIATDSFVANSVAIGTSDSARCFSMG